MDMVSILARIDGLCLGTKHSDRSLSMAAGLSADGIRNWRRRVEKGLDSGANGRSLALVASALGVSSQWLIEGVDNLSVVTSSPVKSQRPQILGNLRHVRVFDIEASAGGGAVITDEDPIYEIGFAPEMLQSISRAANDELAVIRVRGDSMMPTLMDGDMMLVDTTKQNLNYDGMFILRYDDVLRVKRIDKNPASGLLLVKSDNQMYEAFSVSPSDLVVVGRVVWIGRRV